MRILYFSRDLTTHDVRFVDAIMAHGHELLYLRLENDGVPYLPPEVSSRLNPVQWAGGGKRVTSPEELLELLPSLLSVIDAHDPDLIHAGPVQTCGLLSVLAGVRPTVVTSWGSDMLVDSFSSRWNEWATRTALRGAAGFVCDCNAVRELAQTSLALPDEQIAQFPWGLDLDSYTSESNTRRYARHRLNWDNNIIVIASRVWRASLGIYDVVNAFSSAHRRDSRLRMILAGSGTGDQVQSVEALISELDLAKVIHRPGMLETQDLKVLLAASDIYCSGSPSDGSSISLLEAMRSRLPVVVPDNAGNREWVTPHENGILVPVGDVDAMAHALLRLANDRESATRMGAEGQRRVFERANWIANIEQLFRLYDRMVQRGG